MKLMITVRLAMVIFVIACSIDVYGQFGAGDFPSPSKTINSSAREKLNFSQETVDVYFQTPATFYFKDGKKVQGFLLRDLSENAEALFVKIKDDYKIIYFDELVKIKFDEFPIDSISGKIANNDLKGRIDSFVIHLQNNPNAQGYIVYFYGTEVNRAYYASKKKAFTDHIRDRNYDPSRITLVEGGNCGNSMVIEMWVIQPGQSLPVPICPRR